MLAEQAGLPSGDMEAVSMIAGGKALFASGLLRGAQSCVGCFSPQRPGSQERISASTSSRFSRMCSSDLTDSRLRRSSGSVFEGRTLKCQSS